MGWLKRSKFASSPSLDAKFGKLQVNYESRLRECAIKVEDEISITLRLDGGVSTLYNTYTYMTFLKGARHKLALSLEPPALELELQAAPAHSNIT